LDLQFDYLPAILKNILTACREAGRAEGPGHDNLRPLQPHQTVLGKGPARIFQAEHHYARPDGRRQNIPDSYYCRPDRGSVCQADATKFSETGYVAATWKTWCANWFTSGRNVRLAEYGIIYLDEIDKLPRHQYFGARCQRRGRSTRLLKLMEETEVSLRAPFDLTSQLQRPWNSG